MKRILSLFVFILTVQLVFAQQWLEFSQQNQYELFLNPSMAGANSMLYTTVAHRSQYTFLTKRAIASQFGEFSTPIINKNIGVGLNISNDFIGYQRYTSISLNGAYHLYLDKSRISFGIGFGMLNASLNGALLRASGGNYENEAVIHNDEKLPASNSGGLAPTFAFGISYEMGGLQIGAAIQNINSPKVKLLKTNSETIIFIDRTINLNAGYVIELKNVKITPMLNYNTDFIKHQIQLEILSEINNIYFGLAFRGYTGLNNDAIIGMLGLKLKDKIRIGYSYDFNVSGLNRSNFGSHEISLSYYLPRKFSTKNKGNLLFNPRFL